MNFERTSRRKVLSLNLTPLIDVLFILIIFFMLTTSFMRIESLELVLPSVSGKAATKQEVVQIFVYANGDLALGQRRLDPQELSESLARMIGKDPMTRIMLFSADGVSVQQLVNVMDKIYQIGGKSLFVRKWDSNAMAEQ
jgi:biopolymer transport protein ExbD